MTGLSAGVSPAWLALREPADAAARSRELVGLLVAALPASGPIVAHDLACGAGSLGRWLAPFLPMPQRWVLYDRDPGLLEVASSDPPAGSGHRAEVLTRRRDIVRLRADDLANASLVTASALLDMLSAEELSRVVTACEAPGCPVLITLTVVGSVTLDPPDPLDREVEAAFNDHQRRTVAGRRLLGPDAGAAAVAEFARRGREVVVRPSPWHLGPDRADLMREWFTGWVAAAREQRPALAGAMEPYAHRRLEQIRTGGLRVTVGHEDLLVLPRSGRKPVR